jgi:DNA-binding NtrC family response regulator
VATGLELVLDRFVASGGDRAVDLATGDVVLLRIRAKLDDADERKRAEAAALVSPLRISGMAALLDYGTGGRQAWVEAYRPGSVDGIGCGAGQQPLPLRTIKALLAGAGCTVTDAPRSRDAERGPSGVFIPEPLERIVTIGDAPPPAEARAACLDTPAVGTILERRDEVDAVMDWLTGPADAGARLLGIEGPPGSGMRTFFDAIARDARLAGFIPLCSRLCGQAGVDASGVGASALCDALRDRHVVVLDAPGIHATPAGRADVARFLSRLDPAGGRPHAVICAALAPVGDAAIALGPMRSAQLRRSVLCAGIDAARRDRAIEKAVRQSGGWPGAFAVLARVLLGLRAVEEPYRFSRAKPAAVREAVPERTGSATAAQGGSQTEAVLAKASDLARRGRHAAAERLLRRTVGYLSRRKRVEEEGRAQLALGVLLLARGRRGDAREAIDDSRRLFDQAHDAAGVVLALVHLGAVDIEVGALTSAESVLRTAEVGATHANLADLRRAAGLLLARCLLWQGRHEESWCLVERMARPDDGFEGADAVAERAVAHHAAPGWGTSLAPYPDPPGLSTVGAEVGVRTAIARGDAGLAARRLAAAGVAGEDRGASHAGALIALRLLVQGALGDHAAVGRTAASGLRLVRRLHAPLAALEIRLAQVEALIEAGAGALAGASLRRLEKRPAPAVSGLARMRINALAARLELLARDDGRRGTAAEGTVDAAAVVRILQQCHDAHSDGDAVAGVCQAVKTALGASAVSAFAWTDGAMPMAASAGQRACRPELAERAAASLLMVGPEASAAGCEIAAPVRYGGTTVGALAARWAPATRGTDEARARGIMTAAAAAIAPAMAALGSANPPKPGAPPGTGDLGGPSAAMADVRRQVARAAAAPYPVLIMGESGTGKELIAKAIHSGSARRVRRFCAVNCAALSDDLFETELFGHARGAFTGAAADRPGLFEEADGGTLFLDEVGELSPRAQAKLLRAIQEGEVRRVGENHPRRVDTRIVAATNRPLGDEVKAGRFRHDLLYRLDVVRIVVPPLRDRPEDVGPLAREFWREAMRRTGGQAELSPATLAALARYDWPGNVRELQNTLAALAVHAPLRGRVGPARLPAAIAGSGPGIHGERLTLAEARRRFEERFVRATLARTGGHRTDAASALGLSRQGLAKVIARLGIGVEEGAPPY